MAGLMRLSRVALASTQAAKTLNVTIVGRNGSIAPIGSIHLIPLMGNLFSTFDNVNKEFQPNIFTIIVLLINIDGSLCAGFFLPRFVAIPFGKP